MSNKNKLSSLYKDLDTVMSKREELQTELNVGPANLKSLLFTKKTKNKVVTYEPKKEYDKYAEELDGVSEKEFENVINTLSNITSQGLLDTMIIARPYYKKVIKYIGGESANDLLRYMNYIDNKKSEQFIKEDEPVRGEKRDEKRKLNLKNILNKMSD